MIELKELLDKALEIRERKEDTKKEYFDIREKIKEFMLANNLKQTQTTYYDFILSKSTIVDEERLLDEHPDIYYLGIEQKFSIDKLKGKVPKKMIDDIVRKLGKGDDYHVKIRSRRNKSYFRKTRRVDQKIQED